jgi:hypothetical protein
MATIVCDCDSCKHHKNGGCELAVIEICDGHCQDLVDEQED